MIICKLLEVSEAAEGQLAQLAIQPIRTPIAVNLHKEPALGFKLTCGSMK